MTHQEKSRLLEAFAKGVKIKDLELLDKTLKQYETMMEIGIARQLQRENYRQILILEDEMEKKRLQTMNGSLEKIKIEKVRRAEED